MPQGCLWVFLTELHTPLGKSLSLYERAVLAVSQCMFRFRHSILHLLQEILHCDIEKTILPAPYHDYTMWLLTRVNFVSHI